MGRRTPWRAGSSVAVPAAAAPVAAACAWPGRVAADGRGGAGLVGAGAAWSRAAFGRAGAASRRRGRAGALAARRDGFVRVRAAPLPRGAALAARARIARRLRAPARPARALRRAPLLGRGRAHRGAGATGAAAAAGSRGEAGARRGQSTTSGDDRRQRREARDVAPAHTAEQRIGRHDRSRRRAGRLRPRAIVRRRSWLLPAPIYDLILLLDTSAPDDQRAKILADAEATITTRRRGRQRARLGPARPWRTRSATRRTPSTTCSSSTATPALLEHARSARCGSPTASCASGSSSSRPARRPPPKPERAPVEPAEAPAAA